jgi:hypothetical protein
MNVNEQTNNNFYHQWWKSIGGRQGIFWCLLATSFCQKNILNNFLPVYIIHNYPIKKRSNEFVWYTDLEGLF